MQLLIPAPVSNVTFHGRSWEYSIDEVLNNFMRTNDSTGRNVDISEPKTVFCASDTNSSPRCYGRTVEESLPRTSSNEEVSTEQRNETSYDECQGTYPGHMLINNQRGIERIFCTDSVGISHIPKILSD